MVGLGIMIDAHTPIFSLVLSSLLNSQKHKQEMRATVTTGILLPVFLVLFTSSLLASGLEMVPMVEEKMMMMSRRKLQGSFQICALCTCCGGGSAGCLTSPCCYAINCNIPNRPFGFCSFTPKTCNCFACTTHL